MHGRYADAPAVFHHPPVHSDLLHEPAVFHHPPLHSDLLHEPAAGRVDFVHRTFQETSPAWAAVEAETSAALVENAHRASTCGAHGHLHAMAISTPCRRCAASGLSSDEPVGPHAPA